jgi:hypothetical protein
LPTDELMIATGLSSKALSPYSRSQINRLL